MINATRGQRSRPNSASAQLMVLLFISISALNWALVHRLNIHHDDRKIFKIETFGFVKGGRMELTVKNFKIHLTTSEKEKYLHSPAEGGNSIDLSSVVKKYGVADGKSAAESSAPKNAVAAAAPVASKAAPAVQTAPVPSKATSIVAGSSVAPKPAPVTPIATPAAVVAPAAPAQPIAVKPASATSVSSSSVLAGKEIATKPTALVQAVADGISTDVTRAVTNIINDALGLLSDVREPHRRLADVKTAVASDSASAATNSDKHGKGIGSEVKEIMHEKNKYTVGFVMRKASSESEAQADLESIIEKDQCIVEHMNSDDLFIDLSDPADWIEYAASQEVGLEGAGLYSLIFARCAPHGQHFVEFELDATFYNPGWGTGAVNYLSAGDAPLPKMYLVFFLLFSAAMIAWAAVLRSESRGTVHRIHYMMMALLVVKCCSLLFESIRFHYIALRGASELWSIVYYVFAFVKGVMLFTVILLIGSGWSLMKSYLNDKEKKIIYSVLILQVVDNIAMIVLEESAPGSQGWLTWRDILHLVDIICCCAILLPIVWSIRHLKMAAETDGKAYNAVVKLQLFRQFYVMVVAYIYFTRIVVYLLAATIPYYLLWLGPFATETATLIFYVFTGLKFRPAPDNPYLPVRSENLEGEEYGLEESGDDGFELMGNVNRGGSSVAIANPTGRPTPYK